MPSVEIDIWFGEHASGAPRQFRTGRDWTVLVTVPEGEKTFVVAGAGIEDCRGGNHLYSVDEDVYSVDEGSTAGIVGANHCGKTTAQPVRDIFIFFFRPLHWWEKLPRYV